MITYILQSGVLLLLFFAIYKFWLENEKMFLFNRAYLLGSLVFSFILPLKIISIKSSFSSTTKLVQLNEIVIQKSNQSFDSIFSNEFVIILIASFYALVVLLLTTRFLLNLHSFYRKIKKSTIEFIDDESVILVDEAILPHSFWNKIFINKNEFENNKIPAELLAHEKAHLRQKHTLDILFIEILQIIFWFNPILVLYKKAIKLNHEFLADEVVNVQFESIRNYQSMLLEFAWATTTISLASNINYNITKKRFLMMTKKESPRKMFFKASFISVVCSFLFLAFSAELTAQKAENKVNTENEKILNSDIRQPEFPGGLVECYKFVGKNFKTPTEAAANKIQGKVSVEFMVETDGSLSEFQVVKDLGFGVGDEIIRVLKLSPKWNPGIQSGQPVRVLYTLPVTIQPEK